MTKLKSLIQEDSDSQFIIMRLKKFSNTITDLEKIAKKGDYISPKIFIKLSDDIKYFASLLDSK